ncbi:hypothetical protein STEG23_010925 [Scotinomys teguina]
MEAKQGRVVSHYHKLCSRVSRIWGNCRGQHIRSAMDKPHPGKTTFVIMALHTVPDERTGGLALGVAGTRHNANHVLFPFTMIQLGWRDGSVVFCLHVHYTKLEGILTAKGKEKLQALNSWLAVLTAEEPCNGFVHFDGHRYEGNEVGKAASVQHQRRQRGYNQVC